MIVAAVICIMVEDMSRGLVATAEAMMTSGLVIQTVEAMESDRAMIEVTTRGLVAMQATTTSSLATQRKEDIRSNSIATQMTEDTKNSGLTIQKQRNGNARR